MIFGFDWRVIASLLVIAAILWMAFVPSEAQRKRKVERQAQLRRKKAREGARPQTYPKLAVTGITARRGDTTILLTNVGGQLTLEFNGIAAGNYSETIYIRLSGDGVISQFANEGSAQNAYEKGDYGIMAMTMSPGIITQRNIIPAKLPDGVEPFQLEFSVSVIAK